MEDSRSAAVATARQARVRRWAGPVGGEAVLHWFPEQENTQDRYSCNNSRMGGKLRGKFNIIRYFNSDKT